MARFALVLTLILLSGCATRESVDILQTRVTALEARLSKTESAVVTTNTDLQKVEDEVTKVATIKTEVNELHTETHSAFKSIAEKLSDIKRQLRKYQATQAKAQ